ncbi:MAG: DeoR family transcriptional regulator [Patescibacteria group bacterium]|nr:DeoR family transcriptional regulator [Patescibacteria group bacterium]
MPNLDPRKQKILQAIIKQFVGSAEPVGSKTIVVSYKLNFSPATIRNDMAFLEKEGLITQPHTSAGRIPTAAGYRMYVEELADFEKARKLALLNLKKLQTQYKLDKTREKVYDAVSLLSQATANVSFATIPDKKRTFYLGISSILRQPEFQENPMKASQVIEVLEEGEYFADNLEALNLNNEVKIFIGEENLIHRIDSCGLVVTKYNVDGFEGFMGILGPIRMPYAYNKALLEEVSKMLQ